MTSQANVRRLLESLAAHPVLPPTDQLPPNDAVLHALLADLAAGQRSRYADLLRRVADECGLAADELAHRAEFLLACLVLPRTGTHYDVLGVDPTASADEIRRRWATLIQRYHPDHLGGSGWVDDQARRLIEAYQTLKDPDRRRRYDAELARQRATITPSPAKRPQRPLKRRRWVPLVLLVFGSGVGLVIYAWRTPAPLPQVTLPPAPNLQEARQQAVVADALQLARASKLSAALTEESPTPAPVPLPEAGRPPTPLLMSQAVEAPTLAIPQDQKPVDTPRPAVQPPKSATAPAKPPPTPPLHAPAPRQSPDRVSISSPDRLVGDQPETVQPSAERIREIRRPEQTKPLVARIAPDDARAEGRRLASHALALIETFRAAYEGKDLNTMMRLFTAVPREQQTVGRSAVQELYARHFATLDRIRYELSHLALASPAANGALIVEGRFRIRATRRDDPSDPLHAAGAIRWVLRPEADALRIAEIDYELSRP